MNEKTGTGVSSEKEKVKKKEFQSQSRRVTLPLDTHLGCRVGGVTASAWVASLLRTRDNHYCTSLLHSLLWSFLLLLASFFIPISSCSMKHYSIGD